MEGVAENLNVRVTLKLATKWRVGGNNFPIKRLSSDYCATMKQLFHSAVGTLF